MSDRPDRDLLVRAQRLGITARVCELLRTEDRAEGLRSAIELVERRAREREYMELRISLERRMVALPSAQRREIRGSLHDLFVRTEYDTPEFHEALGQLTTRITELESATPPRS